MSELRVLRDRAVAAQADIDRLDDSAPGGSRSLLCKTTTVTTYPSSASSFFAVIAQDADGPETEGASATFTDSTGDAFYAYNVGSAIPATGSQVIVHFVGGKACFRWDG